ncbi:MAG: hypothetical protein J2P37_35550 [Ktedonobacteraceae bacterium]|nr:hypothetical protein [Ktedonobacteraceae bacterium]
MLRGYDPFQELYRWIRVFFFLMGLAVAITIFLSQTTTYIESSQGALGFGLMIFGLALPLLIFIIDIALVLPQGRSLKKLRRQRAAVLAGTSLPRVMQQPVTDVVPISLPLQVRRRLRRGFLTTIIIMLAIFVGGLILLQVPWLVPNPYTLSDLFFVGSGGLSILLASIALMYPMLFLIAIVIGYYMLPELDIDDNGITARCGRDTVTMAWQDIRYFALSNSNMIARRKGLIKAYMYEICDGENIINWAPNTRTVKTYKMDHAAYDTLASEQLPALVMARTGLPLLDLRQIK